MSNPIVYIETTIGEFAVELYAQHSPRTCYNFYELAKMGMNTISNTTITYFYMVIF